MINSGDVREIRNRMITLTGQLLCTIQVKCSNDYNKRLYMINDPDTLFQCEIVVELFWRCWAMPISEMSVCECRGKNQKRQKTKQFFYFSQTMRLFGVSRLSKSIKAKRDFLINYMQAEVKNGKKENSLNLISELRLRSASK